MTAKEFFKRFVWGDFFPAAILLFFGVLTAAMNYAVIGNTDACYAFEFITALLMLAAGAATVAYFLTGFANNAVQLLAGVGCVSIGVWLLAPPYFSRRALAIALGVLLILRAGAIVFSAVSERKEGGRIWIVRIAFGVFFAACGIVACADPFELVRHDWIFAGLAVCAEAAFELFFIVRGGLFREEEKLRFRPVKKPEKEDGGEDE